jgi:hypothetical protein
MRRGITSTIGAAMLAATLLSVSCGRGGGAESQTADLPGSDVEVPTQAQADAEAAASISSANADEEFLRLQREIESDGAGD